jgi:pimeloyl-ACP methyl ester carboxylesterase
VATDDGAAGPTRVHRCFVDALGTPLHIRWSGQGIPLLLVPQSPTSARVLENRLRAFADRFLCIAPDIPGMGQSGTIAEPVPTIALLAKYFVGLLDALSIPRAILYGAHTGALICTEIARTQPGRVAAIVLDGYPIYTAEEAAQRLATYFPEQAPGWDGAHVHWLWWRYREQFLYWPWNTKLARTRASRGVPDPAWLQAGVAEMARTHHTYPKVYAAAFSYAADAALRETRMEAHFIASDTDSLSRKLSLWGPRPGLHHLHPVSGGEAAQLATERRIIDDIAERNPDLPHFAASPEAASATRVYAAAPSGDAVALQIVAGGGRPAIVLPPLPAGSDFLLSRPDVRTTGRDLMLVDPPGINGVPTGRIGATAAAIAAAVQARGLATVDLVAFGTSAALLPALCDALGDAAGRIVAVDGPVEPEAPEPFDATLCPAGGHLLRFWDRWRFENLFSPATAWNKEAIRRGVDEDLAALTDFTFSALSALTAWPAMEAALFPNATRNGWISALRAGDTLLFSAIDSARQQALDGLATQAAIVDLSASGQTPFAWLRRNA